MITINQKLDKILETDNTLTLPFDLRQKSRLRTYLDNGEEVGLMLPRGEVLRHGDCLQAEDGTIIRIHAAKEQVSRIKSDNRLLLQRVCYHLGNRHVPLQISETWISYQQDHVLDSMVRSLGLEVSHVQQAFEPEAGAYHGHSQQQDHAHQHHKHTHE